MTTLSKEDVVRMADECVFDIESSDEYHPENEVIDSGNRWITDKMMAFATLARADIVEVNKALVAENERLKEELQQVTISKDCYFEERNSAREAFHRRVKEVESLQSELTALAAAEADNERLRKALDKILTTDWVSDRVRSTAKTALAQPRDDSALREMIAGVYEECAKVCEERGDYMSVGKHVAGAIRALAEKAKGG